MQALTTIMDLNAELEASNKENMDLWNAMKHIANLVWTPEDADKMWTQFFPFMSEHFDVYVRKAAKACVQSVLAQVRVLWPSFELEKLTEVITDEAALQMIAYVEPAVENLAIDIANQLDLSGGQTTGESSQPPQ